MTLCGLGEPQLIDTAAVARFLRNSAHPDGGFLSCDADDTPDVEYTHYGVGILAMLRRAGCYRGVMLPVHLTTGLPPRQLRRAASQHRI